MKKFIEDQLGTLKLYPEENASILIQAFVMKLESLKSVTKGKVLRDVLSALSFPSEMLIF